MELVLVPTARPWVLVQTTQDQAPALVLEPVPARR
jgi:hypothetical protein